MLSALTISPLRIFDNSVASLDFPDAVGPYNKTIVDSTLHGIEN